MSFFKLIIYKFLNFFKLFFQKSENLTKHHFFACFCGIIVRKKVDFKCIYRIRLSLWLQFSHITLFSKGGESGEEVLQNFSSILGVYSHFPLIFSFSFEFHETHKWKFWVYLPWWLTYFIPLRTVREISWTGPLV